MCRDEFHGNSDTSFVYKYIFDLTGIITIVLEAPSFAEIQLSQFVGSCSAGKQDSQTCWRTGPPALAQKPDSREVNRLRMRRTDSNATAAQQRLEVSVARLCISF